MRAAIFSLAAAAALAVTAGSADARPPAHHGGYSHGHTGAYRSGYGGFGYTRPAYSYPRYGYGYPGYYSGYNSGFGLTIGGPRLGISIGNVYPSYGYGGYYSPYYGSGFGYSPWGW